MKKFLALFLAAAMLVSTMTACSSAPATEGGEGTETEKVLLIGGSGPLTGDYATYGTSVKQGSELAAKEINAAGGVNGWTVEVRVEDDQADGAQAVQAYATLYDDGMDVTLGGTTSGACIAMTEEAVKDGMLLLTPSGSQLECTQYDNCFRVCFEDSAQGLYAANFIKDNAVGEKVAIIYDKSNDYSNGLRNSFVATAAENGLEIVTEQAFTDQSNTDFSVQLQAVKDSGADLLFLPIYAQEAAYIITQADKVGLDVTFFGCDGLDGILEKIGADNVALTEGVMLLTPFAADSETEPTKSFTAAFKADYGYTPDQFAADAYDAVYAIVEAMKHADTNPDDPEFNEKMIKAMTEITVVGTTGTMQWTPEGEPDKNATAVVIVDGVYVSYDNVK
ncbi:MAG: ABC transporter substrate-binding protein [Oscillospiraceae bacterium]|nr:ABC transporter substrate-binding protein [Oscillospiraceae bacterium]MBQ5313103.1 ABC transporter substrate-binding protein [Oscillospiraceae bacterium]MBQ5325339.1 ABC transporter substrate-binding protein [Oscillospiraceae bacterium]